MRHRLDRQVACFREAEQHADKEGCSVIEIISKNLGREDRGVVMELRVDGARVLFRNDAYFGISREEQARRLEKARTVAEDIVYRAYLRMIQRGEWDGQSPAPPLIPFESAAQDRARREQNENPDR